MLVPLQRRRLLNMRSSTRTWTRTCIRASWSSWRRQVSRCFLLPFDTLSLRVVNRQHKGQLVVPNTNFISSPGQTNMNTRANIMYFIEHLLEMASKERHNDYVRMMQRDIIRVVDAVCPENGSGAANVKVVRKVQLLSRMRTQQTAI